VSPLEDLLHLVELAGGERGPVAAFLAASRRAAPTTTTALATRRAQRRAALLRAAVQLQRIARPHQ